MMSQPSRLLQSLIDAAGRLARAGEARVSVAGLAREAGLSRSALYRAYPDREALLAELRARGVAVGATDARSSILAAAVRTFEEVGLQGATVEAIARRAGVAPVTVYRLFGDRAGLIDAALSESSPRVAARALVLRPSADLEADLAGFAATVLAFIAEHGAIFRIALGAPPAELRSLKELRQAPRGATAALTEWFAHQIGEGRIVEADPRELAVAFLGLLVSFAYIGPTFEDMPLEDPVARGRAVARLFLRGAARGRRR